MSSRVLRNYSGPEFLNIGIGQDISIAELAKKVADVGDYRGKIVYDASKPDGTPRKLVDTSRLSALGWRTRTSLEEGLQKAYDDFLTHPVRAI